MNPYIPNKDSKLEYLIFIVIIHVCYKTEKIMYLSVNLSEIFDGIKRDLRTKYDKLCSVQCKRLL